MKSVFVKLSYYSSSSGHTLSVMHMHRIALGGRASFGSLLIAVTRPATAPSATHKLLQAINHFIRVRVTISAASPGRGCRLQNNLSPRRNHMCMGTSAIRKSQIPKASTEKVVKNAVATLRTNSEEEGGTRATPPPPSTKCSGLRISGSKGVSRAKKDQSSLTIGDPWPSQICQMSLMTTVCNAALGLGYVMAILPQPPLSEQHEVLFPQFLESWNLVVPLGIVSVIFSAFAIVLARGMGMGMG